MGNSQFYTSNLAILAVQNGGAGCPFQHGGGYWVNIGPHYLGLSFVKNGKTHFGWAQLNVQFVYFQRYQTLTTTMSGYAYETTSGKSIAAGKT